MRSWARGYRCGVFQFVKSGKWKVGEARRPRSAASTGRRWATAVLISKDLENRRTRRARAGRGSADGRGGALRVPLLDEITYPIKWGWIEVDDVGRRCATARVPARRDHGPRCRARLIAIADLVSRW
jgi:cob(I)alamin adenosyltransferase